MKKKYKLTGCYICHAPLVVKHKEVIYYQNHHFLEIVKIQVRLAPDFLFCSNQKCIGYIDFSQEYVDYLSGERSWFV